MVGGAISSILQNAINHSPVPVPILSLIPRSSFATLTRMSNTHIWEVRLNQVAINKHT